MGVLKDFYRVVTSLKRKKLGSPSHKLCPRCGSAKLRLSSSFDTYPRMYGLTPIQYVCEECGYAGPLVFEVEEDENT